MNLKSRGKRKKATTRKSSSVRHLSNIMFTIYGTPPAPTMSESAPPLSEIGLNTVVIGGSRVSIRERTLIAKPFGRLLHFETDDAVGRPRRGPSP
jgi:hypothetical protein